MRIGFDMGPVQASRRGFSGVGRYGRLLVKALLARAGGHEFVLYVHDAPPTDGIPASAVALVRKLAAPEAHPAPTAAHSLDWLAHANPDRLDMLVMLDPFERTSHQQLPIERSRGLKLAAVVHSLDRFLAQQATSCDPGLRDDYLRLEALRSYDLLLADSDGTRADCQALLGLPERRIQTLTAAADAGFFGPDFAEAMPEYAQGVLRDGGIERKFVVAGGGRERCDGLAPLVDAFALLPPHVRQGHQLVIPFAVSPQEWEHLLWRASARGIGDALVQTGELSCEALRVLYQRCGAFLVPPGEKSPWPLLEAMLCGSPVVADDGSAQGEIVADAGLLAAAGILNDVAHKLASLLEAPARARVFGARALSQARRFDTSQAAERFLDMLGSLDEPRAPIRPRTGRPAARKPRIAFFSPLPPKKTGVSDYAACLIEELTRFYEIDLFHDAGYVPIIALNSDQRFAADARMFPQYQPERNYHGIVYQMGNSPYHDFLYGPLTRYPGVVTLHDFMLSDLHIRIGLRMGAGFDFLRDELLEWYPEETRQIHAAMREWNDEWRKVTTGCAKKSWRLNRRILACSRRVVVHSPWCVEQVRTATPALTERMVVSPLGTYARSRTASARAATRERFHVASDALVFGCFGFLQSDKLLFEAFQAFETVARVDPKAVFLLVGEDSDNGECREKIQAAGSSHQVRFLGRQSAQEFDELQAITDVGVNLRRPPTHGETSATLLGLLSFGVPTIVTDVATFSDFPDGVVR
ncbi:MAG TPA: glycosyltransferase, partial [Isosphaeraceae bacterium]|nr:glycosyltransferase [Isosphaeraceae bacterium]